MIDRPVDRLKQGSKKGQAHTKIYAHFDKGHWGISRPFSSIAMNESQTKWLHLACDSICLSGHVRLRICPWICQLALLWDIDGSMSSRIFLR